MPQHRDFQCRYKSKSKFPAIFDIPFQTIATTSSEKIEKTIFSIFLLGEALSLSLFLKESQDGGWRNVGNRYVLFFFPSLVDPSFEEWSFALLEGEHKGSGKFFFFFFPISNSRIFCFALYNLDVRKNGEEEGRKIVQSTVKSM